MEQLPPVLETPEREPQPPMSLSARLLNVLAAPGEVFDHIKRTEVSVSNWIVPALILMIVSWIGAWLVFSQPSIQQQLKEITDQAVEKQISKGKISEQQAEQARAVAAKFGSMGTIIAAYSAPVVAGLVFPFWGGLVIWLVGVKVFKADFPYMKGVEVAGLAGMVGVLESVLKPLLILITGSIFASPSLALFVKPFDPQNPVHALLGVVNIMTFWLLSVRALGLARLCDIGFGKAAAWIFGVWALQTGLFTGIGFGMQKIFNR